MIKSEKREKLVDKIESHLRTTARHIVKFDTIQETLNFIVESFWSELSWEFVGIILKDGEEFFPKVWKGGSPNFAENFPIPIDKCSPEILKEGWETGKIESLIDCEFVKLMEQEKISTWFTVPLKDEGTSYGFCVIGFHNFVPLIPEAEQFFVEFGKDIAVAMKLARNKEFEKRKISGIKWVNENVNPGSSIEELVQKVLELSCNGTAAENASIYLLDETAGLFSLQSPVIGAVNLPETIPVSDLNNLITYFPNLETAGGHQLSISLIVNHKTIGVLHLENKRFGPFTNDDLELLKFLSNHVSAMFENARLYQTEIKLKQRLQKIMGFQQELVKETVFGGDFDVICDSLSRLVSSSVLLFDRFFRSISTSLDVIDEGQLHEILAQIEKEKSVFTRERRIIWIEKLANSHRAIGIWPIIGSGDLLGYLAIVTEKETVDDVLRLTIEHALNVFAIQFIKQKLVIETKEQVKDSYMLKLFEEKIEDDSKVIEYFTLMNIDLKKSHRIAVMKLELTKKGHANANLIEREAEKAWMWDHVKEQLALQDKQIISTKRDDLVILMIPADKEKNQPTQYWNKLFQLIKELPLFKGISLNMCIGVGGITNCLEDYYYSYKQALQAFNVGSNGFQQQGLVLFDDLGAYALLNDLKDSTIAELFLKKYLAPLIKYTNGSGADLFETLRAYLFNNGNLKDTMDVLFIHRSTLRYRLERIRDILGMDIEAAETRLNLMLAYKLHDLFQTKG